LSSILLGFCVECLAIRKLLALTCETRHSQVLK
jgi:hypothetical protein